MFCSVAPFSDFFPSCKNLFKSGFNHRAVLLNGCGQQYVKKSWAEPSAARWERSVLEAMLSVPFVPLSICPRSNIYVSLLNSEPSFLSCFLLCCALTTFTLLPSAAVRLSVPLRRLCYLTFPVSALLRLRFLASFMFSLMNYSFGDAKTKSENDCQQI